MLIIVDYFLTSAISSVSAFQYVGSVVPAIGQHVELLAALGVVLLGAINIVGIKESATLALYMAIASFITNLVVIGFVGTHMTSAQWQLALHQLSALHGLPVRHALVGFAGAWLAFSGLESISQLSPAMRLPIRTTAQRAILAVVLTVVLTSP